MPPKKPQPAKTPARPPPSEQRKRQASNAAQVPAKRSRRDVEDGAEDVENDGEHEGEDQDLGPWPEIEDEVVSKAVKGKGGNRGRAVPVKKAPTRRYAPKIIGDYVSF
jgi:hypothetical protein